MRPRLRTACLGVASIMLLATPPALAHSSCPDPSAPAVQAAIDRLGSSVSLSQPDTFQQRIALLDDPILLCDGPNPAPALFQLFLRSRYGVRSSVARTSLPEDPDLFERALQTLRRLPASRVVEGAREGLTPELVALALERMRQDWWVPAVGGLPRADRHFVDQWRPEEAIPTAANQLVALLEDSPDATLFAMTTGGGSLVNEIVQPVQDSLFAVMLGEAASRPAVLRALCGVIVDGAPAGAAVAEALTTLTGLDPETDAAVQRARAVLGTPGPTPPLRLPAVAPGRIDGLDTLTEPSFEPGTVVSVPSGRTSLGSGWRRLLAGLALALGVIGAGRRSQPPRRWLGPVFGLAVLLSADGLLDVTATAPAASEHPLFQFIAQSRVALRPLPDAPGQVYTGGGSMRHLVVDVAPPVDRRRVVFLGASSVHGSHYVSEATFPSRIGALHPEIESINFGVGGATAAGVAAAGHTALELSPDALVVMYGHNEVAQFTRLALYNHTSPSLLRARLSLSRSGLYRWLAQYFRQPHATSPPGDLYRSTPPTRAEIADLTSLAVLHLRLQLDGLLSAAHARDVPVLLILPPTNLRFAHLEAFETPGIGDSDDLDRLRREAEQAAAAGDSARAGFLLQQAIDRSASPREMVTPIRNELRALADRHGATVIDAATWMTAHAPDGVTPSGLFWDDVHPTAEGHDVLARLVGPVLVKQLHASPRP